MNISMDELWSQYLQLGPLARRVAKSADDRQGSAAVRVHPVRVLAGFLIRRDYICPPFFASLKKVDEGSILEERFGDQVTETVTLKGFGRFVIVKRVYSAEDHYLHFALMQMPYEKVRHLWHILRLLHRCQMYSFDVEAIAEHVASLVRRVEKKHGAGRPLGARQLVNTVRLRALGVRGDLTDLGLIKAAVSRLAKGEEHCDRINSKNVFRKNEETTSHQNHDQPCQNQTNIMPTSCQNRTELMPTSCQNPAQTV